MADFNQLILEALNTVIASPAIQTLPFTTSSGCTKTSVLNDIEFCNEISYISPMARRSVDQVIDELNYLDETYGPLGSFVIHDSMFFQQPSWLKEWLEKYPKRAVVAGLP